MPVPEVERRRTNIGQVNPTHPLLPVALDCLKDRDRERSSTQELCHRLADLKESPRYAESVKQAQRATTDGESVQIRELRAEARERQREIEQLQQQHRQQIETLQQEIQEKSNTSDRTIATSERQLRQLNQTIQDLQQSLVAKDQRIRELQQQNHDQSAAKPQVRGQSVRDGPLSLHWSKCRRAPRKTSRPSVVVDGNMAYFNFALTNYAYSYDSEKQTWSSLPRCPWKNSSLAVVDGLLTAIGGKLGTGVTNQLLSLTGERKWVEQFPPMPTKRYLTAAVCSGKSLVVAGGRGIDSSDFNTVEVMDTETLQWSTASSLPFGVRFASATICQDHIYLLGYDTSKDSQDRSVLACSLADLLQSCRSQSLGGWLKALTLQTTWHRVADLPDRSSSCATLCGQLLAVGGSDNSFRNDSTAIHQYNPATYSWEVISHMPTARSYPLAAVLPGNKLMVVGGYTAFAESDIVEIATLQD